jgi:fatty acid CoA ligase FadD9
VPQASPIDTFRGALRAAKICEDRDIPHLMSALIDTYVGDLRLLGLVNGA